MKKSDKNIPKKFRSTDKSFINKLAVESNSFHGSSFLPFPKNVDFYGKDSDEDVVLIVRSHWIAYLPSILLALLVMVIPVIFLILSANYPFIGSPVLYTGMLVVAVVIAINIVITTILRWFYTVNIITDQRIVVIEMNNAFSHKYSEAQLEKIEDVTHQTLGFIGTFFDVGNVYIDTAGHGVDFTLKTLPRPRDVQDVINDLLEMKQKGEI
mgnify:CR=1 FL=1|jgi:hypothetical protein